MKKILLAAIVISIVLLTISGCSILDQTRGAGIGIGLDDYSDETGAAQSVLDSADQELQAILKNLTDELAGLVIELDPSVLDHIKVDNNGSSVPISEIADISVRQAKVLVIEPYDKSLLGRIEKAILASDIGITPENDGKRITITYPKLTKEDRRKLIDRISDYGDQTKVLIQRVRKAKLNELQEMVRTGKIAQEEKNEIQKKLQESIDSYNDKVAEAVEKKKEEIYRG